MSILTVDQKKVYDAILYFCRKYEKAYPSIPVIARAAGMCTRKCADHIKELVQLGRVVKTPRWENGRQLSNLYEIVHVDADYKRSYKSSKKSYKVFNKSFKLNDEENIHMPAAKQFSKFHMDAIFPDVAKEIQNLNEYSLESIGRALKKAYMRIRYGSGLYNPVLWIAQAIRNEQLVIDIKTALG